MIAGCWIVNEHSCGGFTEFQSSFSFRPTWEQSRKGEADMETLLNETQVSQKLQVSLACLRRWRLLGAGPEYIKVEPLVRYRRRGD